MKCPTCNLDIYGTGTGLHRCKTGDGYTCAVCLEFPVYQGHECDQAPASPPAVGRGRSRSHGVGPVGKPVRRRARQRSRRTSVGLKTLEKVEDEGLLAELNDDEDGEDDVEDGGGFRCEECDLWWRFRDAAKRCCR